MAKLSYPKTNHDKAKLYLHAMVEVKERMRLIRALVELPFEPLFIQELCYLEFRYICELIAMACLAAQGDYETQRAFTESYKPPEIFKCLREIYPDFFPEPVERIITQEPGKPRHHHVERFHIHDAYAEADVTSLWKAAGGHLHRASLKKYLRTTFSKGPKLDSIYKHAHGLVRLLGGHMIPILETPEKEVRILVEMGQDDEPCRLMFLHINRVASTMEVEEYTAQRVT
jgi:hypothetical protein